VKAMILAAGRGERMRPLTDRIPKPLIEVAGQALILWHIKALVEVGITELVINTCWLGAAIRTTLGDGRNFGARIEYSQEVNVLDTAGGIAHARALLGSESFAVVSADIWTELPRQALLQPLRQNLDAHLFMVPNPVHHRQGDFVLNNGLLQPQGQPCVTYSGMGIFRPRLFAPLAPEQPAPLAPLLRQAMAGNRISGECFAGRWFDIGTPERLQTLMDTLGTVTQKHPFENGADLL